MSSNKHVRLVEVTGCGRVLAGLLSGDLFEGASVDNSVYKMIARQMQNKTKKSHMSLQKVPHFTFQWPNLPPSRHYESTNSNGISARQSCTSPASPLPLLVRRLPPSLPPSGRSPWVFFRLPPSHSRRLLPATPRRHKRPTSETSTRARR